MQSFKRALQGKWLGIAAAALVSAVIFIFGRHLSIGGYIPLDSLGEQLAASTLMPIAYVVICMIQGNVEGFFLTRASGMLDGIRTNQNEADGAGSASSDWGGARASAAAEAELEAMSARFRETRITRKRLRRHGVLGKRWFDQLPWYVIIGTPGSGKSTALANSGLSFPLAEKLSRKSIGVVKATSNCEWWFTDDAVLIDTPGYYVVQKRNLEQDKAVWQGFLRLLSRSRRRQPLSGVLVSIAINELSSSSEEVLFDHARCIRQRILDLYREFGLRLPIYILLTKSDLIAGFNEFFDDLGREGREAVWGFTFAPSESERDPMGSYAAEYDTLVGRLNDRLLERLQQESNIHRRALVFGFPQQVASLKHLSYQFLQEAFGRNAYEDPILLRGIYFVSGMQVGAPFDRIAGARSRTFGISLRATPISPDQKRSYFITRLLRQVVFANAGLVEAHPRVERRQRWLRYSLCTTIAAAMASAAAFLIVSYSRNVHLMEGARLAVSSYAKEAGKLPLDRVDSSDLRPVLPLLDRLRAVKTDYDEAARADNNFSGLGLDQSENFQIQAHAAYRRGVRTILLPRLVFRLETLVAEHQDDLPFLYQALKIYLMLGGRGPFEPGDINEWMTLDWKLLFPAEADAALRRSLADHLDALLDNPLPGISLNGELIEKSRAKLQALSMPRRVLNIITNSTQAANLPTWRLSDHAGPMVGDVLMRKSGQPLNNGIAGIYTRAGFHGTFLRLLPQVADAIAAEGWVLGDQATTSTGEAEETLRRAAMDLYFQEFAFGWDEIINDISLRPMASVDDALRTLNALSAPTSPMRLFLAAAAQETKLGEPPEPDTPTEAKGTDQKELPVGDLQALFRSPPVAGTSESHDWLYTDVHFQWLHQLVNVPPNSPPGAQAPIDSAVSDLAALYQSLGEMQDLAGSNSLEKGDETAIAIRKIEAGAANLPPPIQQWILSVGRFSSKLSMSEAKRHLASVWADGAAELCQRATAGRYPFSRGSRRDTPLGDFGRLFSRDGVIDTFFAQHLAHFVDRPEGPWKAQSTGSDNLQIDREALAQFKRAAAIRDSMFKDAGSQPSIEFLLTVTDTDRSTDEVVVEIDGQQITQRRGAYKPVRFRWPTVGGLGGASVTFNGLERAAIWKVGPWALFRLLDEGKTLPQEATDQVYVRIAAGRHWVTFMLQADNLNNPLSRNLLSRFRCPQI
ncbi:type VI secretion system membrane subunit TssM [Mesorhizobium sp. M1406]|uniref:type VI secretion system membrane subunit TssM n=1 Tax=Mesorhizobium sp. M1406 TaxID=2957099 RepID=UPI003334F773